MTNPVESKHTPEPWKAEPPCVVESESGIGEGVYSEISATNENGITQEVAQVWAEHSMANAILIEAAPIMYKALREIRNEALLAIAQAVSMDPMPSATTRNAGRTCDLANEALNSIEGDGL